MRATKTPKVIYLMAKWLQQASQWHEMYCHDLKVMSSNHGRVELGVCSTSVLSRTWSTNPHRLQKLIYLHLSTDCLTKISLHSSGTDPLTLIPKQIWITWSKNMYFYINLGALFHKGYSSLVRMQVAPPPQKKKNHCTMDSRCTI